MRLRGKATRNKRWYVVEMPGIDGCTQGRSRSEAMVMAADYVVQTCAGREEPVDMRAKAVWTSATTFVVTTNFPAKLAGLVLETVRRRARISPEEMALGAGLKVQDYLQFERGERVPTIVELDALYRLVGLEFEF